MSARSIERRELENPRDTESERRWGLRLSVTLFLRLAVAPGLRRPLAWGILVGLFLAAVAEVVRMLLGANFHIVIPGELYRSGQPSPALMARLVQQYGIHT